jgi:hypothetical protein
MSNVLIGIIGVILFIGLALAGALFLGPRFQESTNNSKASAAVQAVSQVSSAANMANVQNGTAVQAGAVSALASSGFLKSVPSNPTNSAVAAIPVLVSDAGAATGDAGYAVMPLGTNAGPICAAIAKQSGMGTAFVTTSATGVDTVVARNTLPANPSGCILTSAAIGSLTTATHYAFARI